MRLSFGHSYYLPGVHLFHLRFEAEADCKGAKDRSLDSFSFSVLALLGEEKGQIECLARQSVLFLKKQALCEALNRNNKNHKSREKFKTRDEMNEVSKYVCHLCVQIRMGPRN